jgi:hypothetical protein
MKIKKSLSTPMVLLLCTISSLCADFTVQPLSTSLPLQSPSTLTFPKFQEPSQQVPTSRTDCFNESVINQVKSLYNNNNIQQIAHDGNEVCTFFQLASEFNLGKGALLEGTRLLKNYLKRTEIIYDSVVNQILSPLPHFLKKYFDEEAKREDEKIQLEQEILQAMKINITDNLTNFMTDPNTILSSLASKIATMTFVKAEEQQKKVEAAEMQLHLRKTIKEFIDILLSKEIWTNFAPETIWPSVMKTAYYIRQLAVYKVIDLSDDLDDLYQTLTTRFCYYLSFAGATLPVSFYEGLEEELRHENIEFLEIEEEVNGIKSKKEFFLEAIMLAKMKAVAYEKSGIIAN